MLGLLPPFPTRLVLAIVEKEKEENERLGSEIEISSLTSIIRAMINQDISLHRFKDIEEEALQERIFLVLDRDEIICVKCSKRCEDNNVGLFCDCLGIYCVNCSPTNGCPKYPDCECECDVCINTELCVKCFERCDADDTRCLFCDCLGNYCGNCSPGTVCPNYPDCDCGCEACIPEPDEEPDEVCEPEPGDEWSISYVGEDLERNKHLSADEILFNFMKEEYLFTFLSGIYLDCFNKTFPLNVTFMADEFSTEYSSTAMALMKGHLYKMDEELRRKTIEKLNNTFSAYYLCLDLNFYIQVKAIIEA